MTTAQPKQPRNPNLVLIGVAWALSLPVVWLATLYYFLIFTKGVSLSNALYLLGLQEFLLIFLEIPTGIIADKVSRRFSIILGNLLTYLPFLLFYIVDSFAAMVGIFAIKTLGRALCSGADKSLLYDTLCDVNRQKEYRNVVNKLNAYRYFVMAVCVLIGGILAEYDPYLPLILPIPITIIACICLMRTTEPETYTIAKTQQKTIFRHTIEALGIIVRGGKTLLYIVLAFAILDTFMVQMKWFLSPVFVEYGIVVSMAGGITTALFAIKSVASYIASKLHTRNAFWQNADYAIIIIGFLMVAFVRNIFGGVAGLVMVLFTLIFLYPKLDQEVQESIPSHIRATSHSAINMIGSVFATLTLGVFGFLHGYWGLWSAFVWLAALAMLSLFLYSLRRVSPSG